MGSSWLELSKKMANVPEMTREMEMNDKIRRNIVSTKELCKNQLGFVIRRARVSFGHYLIERVMAC